MPAIAGTCFFMKQVSFILLLALGVPVIGVLVWKLTPTSPEVKNARNLVSLKDGELTKRDKGAGGMDHEAALMTQIAKTRARLGTMSHLEGDEVGKTKNRDRMLAEPDAVLKASAVSRGAEVQRYFDVTDKQRLEQLPLPKPVLLMELDPKESGILERDEAALLLQAEKAVRIIEEFNRVAEELPPGSDVLKEAKADAREQLLGIDYVFRARYGKSAWMAHHNALHTFGWTGGDEN